MSSIKGVGNGTCPCCLPPTFSKPDGVRALPFFSKTSCDGEGIPSEAMLLLPLLHMFVTPKCNRGFGMNKLCAFGSEASSKLKCPCQELYEISVEFVFLQVV